MSYSLYKEKIVNFYKKHRRMPGYKEIMEFTGFRSKNAVFKLIEKLVRDGVVEKDKQGKLLPVSIESGVPLLGVVEAGLPSPAGEVLLETMNINELLIDRPDQMFLLEVKGDSMIEAHIQEGDMVLVEKREDAKEGEIAIAEVDGEWTMKYFKKKHGKPYLLPANKKYKPIYPERSLRIGAVVRAVIRKY